MDNVVELFNNPKKDNLFKEDILTKLFITACYEEHMSPTRAATMRAQEIAGSVKGKPDELKTVTTINEVLQTSFSNHLIFVTPIVKRFLGYTHRYLDMTKRTLYTTEREDDKFIFGVEFGEGIYKARLVVSPTDLGASKRSFGELLTVKSVKMKRSAKHVRGSGSMSDVNLNYMLEAFRQIEAANAGQTVATNHGDDLILVTTICGSLPTMPAYMLAVSVDTNGYEVEYYDE